MENNNTTKEIERRRRLQEWFKSDPEIWQDILDEGRQAIHNETVQLESRNCTNREWSSGFVNGAKFLFSMEEYLVKKWNTTTTDKEIQERSQNRK